MHVKKCIKRMDHQILGYQGFRSYNDFKGFKAVKYQKNRKC